MNIPALNTLGWRSFFQQQITLEEWDSLTPARVFIQHRNQLHLNTGSEDIVIDCHHAMPNMTVGDWLLLDENNHFHRLLERSSVFARKAAGAKVEEQLIATNIDTVFIVSSLNNDFNLNRIERYLSLAHEAEVQPVIVLSKADLCEQPVIDNAIQQLRALSPLLDVMALNGLDAHDCESLMPYCGEGQTIAILGSSGVGKSTLANTLLGAHEAQITGAIREDDSKGRHTTTARALKVISHGGLLLDTPGMRELQLFDSEQGIATTFADIDALTRQCKFNDCSHNNEPGCKVQQALAAGKIDDRRLNNYRKLLREQALNNSSLAEKRAKDKSFTKMVNTVQAESRHHKKNG